MLRKKIIAIIIAIICALLTPATLLWAEPPPPPPAGTPTPVSQRSPRAPTAGNCITSVGSGANIVGSVGGVSGSHWAGVINVTMADGTIVQAFCIDLLHATYIGSCYVTGGSSELHVNWLMQNYPPDNNQSNDENAARQSAVWYFSDGFVVTSPANIVARTNQIIAAVPPNPTPNSDMPLLRISPSSVNLIKGQSSTFTLTAVRGSNPIAGQIVYLTTDFGTLSGNQVTTGSDGTATFGITSNFSGTAHITGTMKTTIPAGTVMDAVIVGQQRIMAGKSVSADIFANSLARWNNPTAVTLSSFNTRPITAPDWNMLVIPILFIGIGAMLPVVRRVKQKRTS